MIHMCKYYSKSSWNMHIMKKLSKDFKHFAPKYILLKFHISANCLKVHSYVCVYMYAGMKTGQELISFN